MNFSGWTSMFREREKVPKTSKKTKTTKYTKKTKKKNNKNKQTKKNKQQQQKKNNQKKKKGFFTHKHDKDGLKQVCSNRTGRDSFCVDGAWLVPGVSRNF